jgi:hypothetical protein
VPAKQRDKAGGCHSSWRRAQGSAAIAAGWEPARQCNGVPSVDFSFRTALPAPLPDWPHSMVVSKCSPFTLHGPMTKASHAARRQCARSYRSAEITLSHGRLVAEEVAYDLNLACETLREPV